MAFIAGFLRLLLLLVVFGWMAAVPYISSTDGITERARALLTLSGTNHG